MKTQIVKLGEAGRWHVLVATSLDKWFTACGIALKPLKSPFHDAKVETSEGEPTCAHCKRRQKLST